MERQHFPCPVCGESKAETVFLPKRQIDDPKSLYGAASGIHGTQTLVGCAGCGLVYENPRFPDEVILRGYMESEEGGHDSQFEMRVLSFLGTLQRLGRQLPLPGARILDIGTAGGAFLDAAIRYGYDAHGMEPSAYLVEQGKKRGLQIEQGTIDTHGFAHGSFDMVTLWDVIEHLTDPRKALEEARRLLKPDGILLINYPDIDTWQARLAGHRFWWILSVHLQHFTPATICEICRRTGFEAYFFKPYWQTLQFGYLESMAAHLGVPLAGLIHRLTPEFIRRIPLPYYASQTTALARITARR